LLIQGCHGLGKIRTVICGPNAQGLQIDGAEQAPISLVHGVFGSGKSTLLRALICFLCRLIDEHREHAEQQPRASGAKKRRRPKGKIGAKECVSN